MNKECKKCKKFYTREELEYREKCSYHCGKIDALIEFEKALCDFIKEHVNKEMIFKNE